MATILGSMKEGMARQLLGFAGICIIAIIIAVILDSRKRGWGRQLLGFARIYITANVAIILGSIKRGRGRQLLGLAGICITASGFCIGYALNRNPLSAFLFAYHRPPTRVFLGVTIIAHAEPLLVLGDTIPVTIVVENFDDTPCNNVVVSINAPAFELSPAETTRRISIPPNEKRTIAWIVRANILGDHFIFVSATTDELDVASSQPDDQQLSSASSDSITLPHRVRAISGLTPGQHFVKIRVLSVLGLSARQVETAKVLCYVLGPTLTLPWWIALFGRRRAKEESNKPDRPELILPDDPN